MFQGAFPGNLQLVLVLRPSRFFQKAIADIGIKLHKDDFKMKVPVSVWMFKHMEIASDQAELPLLQRFFYAHFDIIFYSCLHLNLFTVT